MRRALLWTSLIVSIVISSVGLAQGQPQGPIIALFDMEDKGAGLDRKVLDDLTEYLAAQLAAGGYQVVPRDQVRQRLSEKRKESYKECFDESCQIELGRELAAQKALATKVLKIGLGCQLTAVLFDLKKSTTELAATADASCDTKSLLDAVKKVADDLSAPLRPKKAGPPPDLRVFKWTALGIGVAGLALGGLGTGLAVNYRNAADTVSEQATFDDYRGKTDTWNKVALGGYIGGGVFAAAAVTLFTLDAIWKTPDPATADPKTGASIAAEPLPGGGFSVSAGWNY